MLAKYYKPKGSPYGDPKGLTTQKEQRNFEKGLWDKTKKAGQSVYYDSWINASSYGPHYAGDIILYDGHLAVFKHSADVIFYIIGNAEENELMLSLALNSFQDALSMLLRFQIEKRALLENYDLAMLCLDETIDDGWVASIFHEPRC